MRKTKNHKSGVDFNAIDRRAAAFFLFRQLQDKFLLTNDTGAHVLLDETGFNDFLSGHIRATRSEKFEELASKGFIRSRLDFDRLSQRYAKKKSFLLAAGPSLHIIVVTLRCDHHCTYCQASAKNIASRGFDMTEPIARDTVDRIFESTSAAITIEFQGGEPLANFEIIKFIVGYALKKNRTERKNLRFTLVSNLAFMSKPIMKFLLENNIHICASLDGPGHIHNIHRVSFQNQENSHRNASRWLKQLTTEYNRRKAPTRPSALATVTRQALSYPHALVDEYLRLGLTSIHLRPISPFGYGKKTWKRLAYSAQDFLKFYKRALDYILKINLGGVNFHERFAHIFLTKILTESDPNYLDIRSPCGAGIGQLAYNFNGDVYTCDEGRMLSQVQDESFRLGNVAKNTFREFMEHPVTKTMCVASCLDNLPGCSWCAYKPYCGVCPIFNHQTEGNIFRKNSFLCSVYRGILDILFEKMRNENTKKIFLRWVTS